MERKRNKSIKESLADSQFVEANKRVQRKLKDKPTAVVTTDCSTWQTKNWTACINELLKQFEVPAEDWFKSNIFKKKKLTEAFVERALTIFKSPAGVLEALANIIVTWNTPEKRFFGRHLDQFNISYVTKALSGYVKQVKEKPTSRLAAYDVSKEFSRRMANMLAGANTTEWLQDLEPQRWDDHGEQINPLDDLI